ncbi:MAG: sigma-54-dependent transcriptional regulator, partial [Bacteroidales bacterium]
LIKERQPDLVITDFQMPGLSGIEVVEAIRQVDPQIPVIVLTAYGDTALTIESIQAGAFDFIEKPINPRELLETVKNGLDAVVASQKAHDLVTESHSEKSAYNLIVGKTPAMRELFKTVGRLSQSRMNVMISGEPGTGKGRFAQLIHNVSPNSGAPLVYLNCRKLDESGDYMGADVQIPDHLHELLVKKFREADNGSLILDEIGMLPPEMQHTLLDILNEPFHQERAGQLARPRIISLTTGHAGEKLGEGKFLQDLFYNLNVFSLQIPPLRRRKEDIPELVKNLLPELNAELGKNVSRIGEGVMSYLQAYDWPGNVRELKNILMQAVALSYGEILEKKYIHILDGGSEKGTRESVEERGAVSLAEVEREHIAHVLGLTSWNKQEAARILGITRPTLNAKIEKYGLSK